MGVFRGTKGQWKIKHSLSNYSFNIVGSVFGGKYKIARIPYPYDNNFPKELNEREKLEAEANAKLIAAAPELLEALQSIATGEISGNTKNYKDTVFIMKQIAIEAIKKATE